MFVMDIALNDSNFVVFDILKFEVWLKMYRFKINKIALN